MLGSNSDNNVYVHGNKFIGEAELETMGISVEVMSGNVSYTNPPTKEMSEKIFSSLFDILHLSFVDSGNSFSNNVYPEINWEEKGESKVWLDIVGWNNLTERNGVLFIPSGEQPIVKYGAENAAGPIPQIQVLLSQKTTGPLQQTWKSKQYMKLQRKRLKKSMGCLFLL